MADEIMTIKVFTKDRAWLRTLFGEPTHVAFHKVRELCIHPEAKRTYISAVIPWTGDVVTEDEPTRTVYGFHCETCGKYIFPDPRVEE